MPQFCTGDQVSTVRGARCGWGGRGYPVTGIIRSFAPAVPYLLYGAVLDSASVLVTTSIGLYREGDLITVPLAALEPAPVAADDAGQRKVPERCEAMLGPPGGRPLDQIRGWPMLDEKCMERATVIMAFRCERGHAGMNAKCDAHSRDDGTQFCGYCAFAGLRVPVAVSIAGRL